MRGIRSASEPYALLCARTIRERLGSDWGLAETGATGPAGNRYGDKAGHSSSPLQVRSSARSSSRPGARIVSPTCGPSRERHCSSWRIACRRGGDSRLRDDYFATC